MTRCVMTSMIVVLLLTGCYAPIKGKVVDAETGAPIEGAVAMAEWTRTKGFGNTYTVSVKVSEAVSDKEGNFELDGCYSPFVDKPSLTIYKNSYVAWNNQLIFPYLTVRDGFEWKNAQVFRIEKFKQSYSHDQHLDFIEKSINSSINLENKKMIYEAYYQEVGSARAERKKDKY